MWLAIAGFGFPLVAGYLLRQRPELQVAGVLAVSVLFAPILRINYLPLLVPCALVWWSRRPWRGRSLAEQAARVSQCTKVG